MEKNFNCKRYDYKGVIIYKVTAKDYCVWNESGIVIHEQTLKAAKAEIDKNI